MAREESDREDLLREATALVERIELAPLAGDPEDPAGDENIFVGFRREGAASIYFGSDPAYHFNAAGELRRAYVDGRLIKAVGRRLTAMERVRTADEVQLVSRQLSESEQQTFLAEMMERIRRLESHCRGPSVGIVGQVPAEVDVLSRVVVWLATCTAPKVAASPRVG
jgi:hypothetical protein